MESKLHIIIPPNNKSKFYVLIQILKQRNVDPKLIKKVQKYCHKLDCFTYIHITSWLKIEFHDIWSESTVNKLNNQEI